MPKKLSNQDSSQDQLADHLAILKLLEAESDLSSKRLRQILGKFPSAEGGLYRKSALLSSYRQYAGTQGLAPFSERVARVLQKKPTRTVSGVAPITVLTKPFPCPGKCIFCPNDIRMPKSYLADEPGAQRAERNWFDPYLQTYTRLQALTNLGHAVDKAELIVLGGTWSYYPESYQIWFIKECFRAMNEFGKQDDRERIKQQYQDMQQRYRQVGAVGLTNQPSENAQLLEFRQINGEQMHKTYNQVISELYVAPERKAGFDQYQQADWSELEQEQAINAEGKVRCVGLVLETRPDNISLAEVVRMRRLGATKAQIGVQSLQDEVLRLNKRGHDVAATRRAFHLLRQAGFKIHAHWMPNLYGSSVEQDKADYLRLFGDPDFQPDELKIYPCSLIESAELMQQYRKGQWRPYTREELLEVLTFCVLNTPPYCRLTRVIRDIPGTDIVEGNKVTNFREVVDAELKRIGAQSQDIRAREIRHGQFDADSVTLSEVVYQTSNSTELFMQYLGREVDGADMKLLGFLRLSLPSGDAPIEELAGAAIIREVHVYGEVVALGAQSGKKAQHLGLGKKLIARAKAIALEKGYAKLAVISAIGTRQYYAKQGFQQGQLYQSVWF